MKATEKGIFRKVRHEPRERWRDWRCRVMAQLVIRQEQVGGGEPAENVRHGQEQGHRRVVAEVIGHRQLQRNHREVWGRLVQSGPYSSLIWGYFARISRRPPRGAPAHAVGRSMSERGRRIVYVKVVES